MIYVLYGQPGSGKTTLGKLLAGYLDTPFIIDGDEFRQMFANKNYGFGGRRRNIRAANAVATYLNKKGKDGDWKAVYIDVRNGWESRPVNKETHVVMTLVNPYEQFRKELKEDNDEQVREVFLFSRRGLRREYHVKDFETGTPDCKMNTDRETEDSFDYLKTLLNILTN